MARNPTTTRVLKRTEIENGTSAPPAEQSAPALTKREEAKQRHVSLKQAATLIGRDRNTLMKYLDDGMPFVEKADRDRGASWILDLADVVRWLEKRAAENASEKVGSKEGQITEDEAKRRRAVAQAFTAELEYAETARIVARINDMLDLVKRDYSEVSQRLKGVPDAIASKVDAKVSERVRATATELIGNTLKGLSAVKDIERIASGT